MSDKKNEKSNEKKPPTKYSDAGKGSKSRVGISPKKWGERYEKIFGKKSDKDGDSIQVEKVIWFTGQPGSGKTTLAEKFIDDKLIGFMKMPRWKIIHIDGDDIRKTLARTDADDYSRGGRTKNIRWVLDTTVFLVSKGYLPIISMVSPYRWMREGLKGIGRGIHYKKEQPRFKVLEVYCHTTEIRGKEKYFVEDYEPPLQNFLDMNTDKPIKECLDEILSIYREIPTIS